MRTGLRKLFQSVKVLKAMPGAIQLSLFKLSRPDHPSFRKRQRRSAGRRRPGKDSPELKLLWLQIRRQYFPNRPDIDDYTVAWSTRKQLRTLASCSLERRKITVARELNYPDHRTWLDPLLYHEMCHAILDTNVSKQGGRNAWHGPEFQALEARHPLASALDAWIQRGGWASAIRSDRAKRAHRARKIRP